MLRIVAAPLPKLRICARFFFMGDQNESNSANSQVWAWDHDAGFALYCLGMTTDEVGAAVGISGRMIRHQADKDGWEDRREKVAVERALRVGKKAGQSQEFIRATELSYSRRLFGMAEQLMREIKVKDGTLLDLTRLLDLASRLGRLGSGLPLNQVEITQTYDIGEGLQQALARAYAGHPELGGSPAQAQVIDIAPEPSQSTQPPQDPPEPTQPPKP